MGKRAWLLLKRTFDFFASKTGCSATGSRIVDCLQDLPAEVIVQFFLHKRYGFVGELPFPDGWSNASWTPTIDGVTLTDAAHKSARRGDVVRVPVIMGSSGDAGGSVAKMSRTSKKFLPMTLPERKYYEWAEANFPHPWSQRLLETYSVNKSKPFWAAVRALSDYVFKCPTYKAALNLAQLSTMSTVFLYNFPCPSYRVYVEFRFAR